MVQRLDYHSTESLSKLRISPGDLVAFEGGDINNVNQTIIAVAEGMYRGHKRENGRKLVHWPDGGKFEEWTFEPKGDILELMDPKGRVELPGLSGNCWQTVPNSRLLKKSALGEMIHSYDVITALVGVDAITKYFQQANGMGYYAKCIESGKLVTKRSSAGRTLEALGLGPVIPNVPRFRRYFFF